MSSSDPSASRDWHKSLTMRGAALAALGPVVSGVVAKALVLIGVDPSSVAELSKDAAALVTVVGAILAGVGRMRLGDLG